MTTNNEKLNKALNDMFNDVKETKSAVIYGTKKLISCADLVVLNRKTFLTRKEVQTLTGYSKSTIDRLFQDPDFPKSTLGKSELVHKDALADYFKKPRSRENSNYWKNC